MKECILYEILENDKVKCTACNHYCKIPNGNTGICGVRQNQQGKLYLLTYGKAAAVNIDPIEKKPLYHFLPGEKALSIGTLGCNFACKFCQNSEISQSPKIAKKEKIIELIEKTSNNFSPQEIIDECIARNIKIIAYTYNEPAVFIEYAYDTMKLAKENNIKNVFVSSGYESDESLKLILPFLDAINIDLKSFDDDFYKKICGGSLKPVIENIKKIHDKSIWMEITTLIIPGNNDSNKELNKIAEFIASINKNIPWHISAFHPMYKMKNVPSTSKEKLEKAYDIGKNAGLNHIYVGNIIDNEKSSTYCPECKTKLINREGFTSQLKEINKGICKKCGKHISGVWKKGDDK